MCHTIWYSIWGMWHLYRTLFFEVHTLNGKPIILESRVWIPRIQEEFKASWYFASLKTIVQLCSIVHQLWLNLKIFSFLLCDQVACTTSLVSCTVLRMLRFYKWQKCKKKTWKTLIGCLLCVIFAPIISATSKNAASWIVTCSSFIYSFETCLFPLAKV